MSAPVTVGVPRSSWALTGSGVAVSASLEARRLLRSRAWLGALIVWVVVVTGLTGLLLAAVAGTQGTAPVSAAALVATGIIGYGVLGFGALVAPALTATSVNGDRRDGTLAAWQMTLLTPAEIVTGRLLVGWGAAAALVLATLPALLLAVAVTGSVPASRLVVTLLVIVLTLMAVVSIGLAVSAVLPNPVASTVVTYVLVVALGFLGPILFGLTTAGFRTDVRVVNQEVVEYDSVSGLPTRCVEQVSVRTLPRTDLTWPLLVTSPFVVVADATPAVDSSGDLYAGISQGVRTARLGPQETGFDACDPEQFTEGFQDRLDALPAVWGWGVAWLLAIIGWCWVVAVRRLQVPVRRLAPGQRIA